jgi:hypothetical protein
MFALLMYVHFTPGQSRSSVNIVDQLVVHKKVERESRKQNKIIFLSKHIFEIHLPYSIYFIRIYLKLNLELNAFHSSAIK